MRRILLSPFILIIFIWLLLSFPFFFQGLVPFPSSYQVNFFSPWSAYSDFASPYKNGATPDVISQIYPWRKFTIDTWKQGVVPLWNPYSFSGTYHLANYQSAVFSPFNLGFFVLPFIEWWSILVLLQPLLAGIFMLLYVRALSFSKSSQIISSVSFMFCGFLVTWMMYGTLGYAILFLPLALYAIEKYYIGNKFRYSFLLFFTIPLSFFSGHFQISLYFLIFSLYYLLFKAIETRKIKASLLLLTSVFFGLLASSLQLFPSIEAYSQSIRSGIFQKIESIPWSYVPTFIVPDFYGNPVTRNDWFGHYAEWNAYIGFLPLFFCVYAISRVRKKHIIIFILPALFSLMLAFQTPLLDLLIYLKIPVLSTSAASRIIVLYSFSASVLAGYGLYYFFQDVKKENYIPFIVITSFFLAILSFLWVMVVFKLFLEPEKIQIAFSNIRLPSLIFIFSLISAVCFVIIKNKIAKKIIISLFIFIVIFDLFRFAAKWQPFDPKELVFKQLDITNYYENLSKQNRVFMNSGAEGMMYYGLQSVEGYDAVYIKHYGDFISSLRTGDLESGFRSVVSFPKDSPYATSAANLLGIQYIIHRISDGQNIWAFPFWKYDPISLRLLFDDGKYQILENTNAFPKAFFVQNIIIESNPQEIIDTMFKKGINLLSTAVVEEKLNVNSNLVFGNGTAIIDLYTPNRVEIRTDVNKDSFLVLTDSYEDSWKAYADDKETKIYRTNFTFRGVVVPKETKKVVFTYEPKSFQDGIITGIIGVVGIALLGIFNRKKT